MMKLRTNFAITCDYAFFSEHSKLNIIGIFKDLNLVDAPTEEKPYIHPMLYFVANFTSNDIGNYEITVDLVGPKENSRLTKPITLEIKATKENEELGIFIQLLQVKFTERGTHKIIVKDPDGSLLTESSVFVKCKQ